MSLPPSAPPPPFGQWLKHARHRLDLTQEELATLIGCALDTMRKLESGERRPSRQIADLLAEVFAIPADEQPAFLHFARLAPAGRLRWMRIALLTIPRPGGGCTGVLSG